MDKELLGKWLPVNWIMPDIEMYCIVSSGYQSNVVEVLLLDLRTTFASLQLYGSSNSSWASEWWENGMLSGNHIPSKEVIGWRHVDHDKNIGDDMFMDVDRLEEEVKYCEKRNE